MFDNSLTTVLTVPQMRRCADAQMRRCADAQSAERLNRFQFYTEAWIHVIASGGGVCDVDDGVD